MINCFNIEKFSRTEKTIFGTITAYSRLYETINNNSILYSEENIRKKVVYYEIWLKKIIGDTKKQKEIDKLIKEKFSKVSEEELTRLIKEIVNRV